MDGAVLLPLNEHLSKKIENHCAAVALGYFAYNFINIHRTLRVTHPPWPLAWRIGCGKWRTWLLHGKPKGGGQKELRKW